MAERPSIPAIVTTDLSADSNNGGGATTTNVDEGRVSPSISLGSPDIQVDEPTSRPSTPDNQYSSKVYGLSPHTPHHVRTPSDPNYLTPSPILKIPNNPQSGGSLSPSPHSPGGESTTSGGTWYPPSPTLSTKSSVHFVAPTTLALRDNNPTAGSGMESLSLLNAHGHRRHASSATDISFSESGDGTDPDSASHVSGLKVPILPISESRVDGVISPTVTHVDSDHEQSSSPKARSHSFDVSSAKKSKKSKKEEECEEDHPPPIEHPDPDLDTSDPAPFTIKPLHLASLVDPKSVEVLRKMGGVDEVLRCLGTHPKKGLCGVSLGDSGSGGDQKKEKTAVHATEKSAPSTFSLDDRRRVYGVNAVPSRKSKTLLQLMWHALKDKILIMLSIAAVISLALGLFEDFGTPTQTVSCDDGNGGLTQCPLPKVDWVEGVAIMIAIVIVDVVGSVNDWQKERQFKSLNEKKEDRSLKVIRDGHEKIINIKEVVVGDVAVLEPGEIIPCDGIFLRGHSVRCDESGATGESDAIRKVPYSVCMKAIENDDVQEHEDCFLISGSKVLEGVGEYVIIAVGTRSFNGRIMLALRTEGEETPLQSKLNAVAELIAKLGTAAGVILFSALMIRFFVQLGTMSGRTPSAKALAFVNILVISFTLVVVAVPEGLPLAVTLALAFATKRMTKEKLLVRVLASCETMANASVVCTDKTGTLSQNVMSVVAGSVGIHAKFVRKLKQNMARTNAEDGSNEAENLKAQNRKHRNDFSLDQSDLNTIMTPALQKLFNEAIALNSTAFEDTNPDTGKVEFIGSKTETALLMFAKDLGWENYQDTRDVAEIVQMIPFSSDRKAMGVVVKVSEKRYRVYLKGASEILTKKCTKHVVVSQKAAAAGEEQEEIQTKPIDELTKDNISRTIIFYANQMLRTIAICYRDLDEFPGYEEEIPYEQLSTGLTLIAITGIEDPLRDGVSEAVANCHKAGVAVKMCTGDNVLTARSIASQCGIFTPGGIVMEGPVFRTLDEHDMKEILPRLQVLARSSPEDKKILVENLKAMGEIVGVTGDGTNDGPALKTANVGFSMGIAGTEVAKEASDIILMDDNFASIVSAIIWGRCVNDAVRKFLQFQISVNITAVIITFITAVASQEEASVLSAVQLLWINIIMDTFAALALATDPASLLLLERKPDRKSSPLFTVDMWKQVFGQATYQTIVVLIFHFLGPKIFGHATGGSELQQRNEDIALQAFVFNAFVFCQIFNSINCRRLDNRLNIFEGITRNWYFIGITLIEVIIQILVMFFGGAAFQVGHITGLQWAISIVIGLGTFPLGVLIRCIPNELARRFFIKIHVVGESSVLPTIDPVKEKGEWNAAIDAVRDNLNTFARVRGGRLRSSSIVRRSRISKPKDVALPSLMTMVPTIVATSVAGRWGHGSLSDPAYVDPSRSSAALWEGKIQFHPDTARDDPAFQRWGGDARP